MQSTMILHVATLKKEHQTHDPTLPTTPIKRYRLVSVFFSSIGFNRQAAEYALTDRGWLFSAFSWKDTPQGADYWIWQDYYGLNDEAQRTLKKWIRMSQER